ncbi:MAG: LLM class flavin-dependent oxidoreductase [Candidatus Ranarchaeia archaeon]
MQIALPIQLGVLLRPNTSYPKWEKLAPIVEKSGFESIWAGSTPTNWDVHVALCLAIKATKQIPVGLSLTNPYVCHPVLTAMSAISLNNLSGGRFILAYGAGTMEGLHAIGMDWEHPLLANREAIEVSKRLFQGGNVTFRGKTVYLTDFHPCCSVLEGTRVPLYLGARRPKMLQLAGELCDGVILDHPPLSHVQYDIEQLNKGAANAKRTLMHDNFSISMACPFSVSEDSDAARENVRQHLALPFISITKRELTATGLSFEEIKPIQNAMSTRTPDSLKNAAQFITDKMVDEFAIAGTPDECIRKIVAYEDVGINRIILAVSTEKVDEALHSLELAKKEILPFLSH